MNLNFQIIADFQQQQGSDNFVEINFIGYSIEVLMQNCEA